MKANKQALVLVTLCLIANAKAEDSDWNSGYQRKRGDLGRVVLYGSAKTLVGIPAGCAMVTYMLIDGIRTAVCGHGSPNFKKVLRTWEGTVAAPGPVWSENTTTRKKVGQR